MCVNIQRGSLSCFIFSLHRLIVCLFYINSVATGVGITQPQSNSVQATPATYETERPRKFLLKKGSIAKSECIQKKWGKCTPGM